MPNCVWKGCTKMAPAGQCFIDGQPHCLKHYKMKLTLRFQASYRHWKGGEVTKRFLYNWSRYLEEIVYENGPMPGRLSKARLRDRTFDHRKTKDGLTFSIIRHPGAFKYGYVREEVRQDWLFKISTGELILKSEGRA